VDIDTFIGKYGADWKRLEAACGHGVHGLTRLPGREIRDTVRLYLRVAGHLAEARASYRDPALLDYLNRLVSQAHTVIYSASPKTLGAARRLFGVRYREAIHRTAPAILVMATLLVLVTVLSWLWVTTSREAQLGLLPPGAREVIRHATGHRRDFGVDPAATSTVILTNNVQVAFLAFALGISLGIGTIFIVIQNALLLGVLAGAFQAAGRAGPFWTLILPHGLLELTAICIAAGAGLRMGWSVIAPGDRPRGRALVEESRDAVIVVVGVIPAFVVAALIEGFLTGVVPGWFTVPLGVAVDVGYLLFLFGPDVFRRRRRDAPSARVLVPATDGRTP
jgi:uncharacterized membrane protein SpoIIM required for sporulation